MNIGQPKKLRIALSLLFLVTIYIVAYAEARRSGTLLYLGNTIAMRQCPPCGCVRVGEGQVVANDATAGSFAYLAESLFTPCRVIENSVRRHLQLFPQ